MFWYKKKRDFVYVLWLGLRVRGYPKKIKNPFDFLDQNIQIIFLYVLVYKINTSRRSFKHLIYIRYRNRVLSLVNIEIFFTKLYLPIREYDKYQKYKVFYIPRSFKNGGNQRTKAEGPRPFFRYPKC